MAIQDQNRSRKVYSFFRALPIPLPVTGESDLLFFQNIGELSAYDASKLESGKLAFVKNIRDYFFIERYVNSGSQDTIQDVNANGSGVWHRMGLGGGYWKNQLSWWIDAEVGDDENLGASDSPLKTLDELVRRLLGVTKIRSDYVVTLTSVTQSITNTFGLDVELDGGSVTLRGSPLFSESLGTISSFNGAVHYASGTAPRLTFNGTGSLLDGLLYSKTTHAPFVYTAIGWPLGGETNAFFTTAFTTATPSTFLFEALSPSINTPGIMARGRGRLILSGVHVGTSGNAGVVLGGDTTAPISLVLADLRSNAPELAGGTIVLDRSRLHSESGSIMIHNGTRVFGSGSGFITPNKYVHVRDCHFELGATTFWESTLGIRGSQVILATPNVSGSGLMSSSLEAQSDVSIDVRNLIASRTNGISSPVLVTGQNVSIFYDDVSVPKANNVTVNNGFSQSLTWAQMPFLDMARNVKIVSGSLQSALSTVDGG